MMSLLASFCAVFFPRDVLGEILDLIGPVSEGFPTYSCVRYLPLNTCSCAIILNGIAIMCSN